MVAIGLTLLIGAGAVALAIITGIAFVAILCFAFLRELFSPTSNLDKAIKEQEAKKERRSSDVSLSTDDFSFLDSDDDLNPEIPDDESEIEIPGPLGGIFKGMEAFRKGDYATTLREIRPLAEQGHGTPQGILGAMYMEGMGVSQDYNQAFKWFKLAAENGDKISQFGLGKLYYDGQGVSQDYSQAFQWIKLSTEKKDTVIHDHDHLGKAKAFLGTMYLQGKGTPQSHSEAMKWFKLAAQQGNVEAQVFLGGMHLLEEVIPQNFTLALMWYNVALANGTANNAGIKEVMDDITKRMTPEQIAKAEELAIEFIDTNDLNHAEIPF